MKHMAFGGSAGTGYQRSHPSVQENGSCGTYTHPCTCTGVPREEAKEGGPRRCPMRRTRVPYDSPVLQAD